jgi:uncharacterized membrane protein YgcG
MDQFEYLLKLAQKKTEYGLAEGLLAETKSGFIRHTIIEDFNLPEDLFHGLEDVVKEINSLYNINS